MDELERKTVDERKTVEEALREAGLEKFMPYMEIDEEGYLMSFVCPEGGSNSQSIGTVGFYIREHHPDYNPLMTLKDQQAIYVALSKYDVKSTQQSHQA